MFTAVFLFCEINYFLFTGIILFDFLYFCFFASAPPFVCMYIFIVWLLCILFWLQLSIVHWFLWKCVCVYFCCFKNYWSADIIIDPPRVIQLDVIALPSTAVCIYKLLLFLLWFYYYSYNTIFLMCSSHFFRYKQKTIFCGKRNFFFQHFFYIFSKSFFLNFQIKFCALKYRHFSILLHS